TRGKGLRDGSAASSYRSSRPLTAPQHGLPGADSAEAQHGLLGPFGKIGDDHDIAVLQAADDLDLTRGRAAGLDEDTLGAIAAAAESKQLELLVSAAHAGR